MYECLFSDEYSQIIRNWFHQGYWRLQLVKLDENVFFRIVVEKNRKYATRLFQMFAANVFYFDELSAMIKKYNLSTYVDEILF